MFLVSSTSHDILLGCENQSADDCCEAQSRMSQEQAKKPLRIQSLRTEEYSAMKFDGLKGGNSAHLFEQTSTFVFSASFLSYSC
jgi:hypothetical protein